MNNNNDGKIFKVLINNNITLFYCNKVNNNNDERILVDVLEN